MKLHWGHKIGIVYALFAGSMIFMLILSMQEKHELVNENYYENELAVQGKINADKNLKTADFDVDISSANKQILVSFMGLPSGDVPTGTVMLYKPDDSSLDQTIDVALNADNKMLIQPIGDHGRYKVSVRFKMSGIDYLKEKQVVL
ncbi:hypothetical protein G3O08_10540 [Cryomorpha ignava]|uniref:Nitrogen fixation protein FixH n=1 Tax=Cryomorpha ignava TaxID=101383 RepID=A0A7K3WQY9_9FLAO|nr:FixH family protein [Cryomorpha ignava]NEN23936.1 hypothetical protein [Cryomorpha ignava]